MVTKEQLAGGLIAAAPELLEALENLLQQLRFSRLPKIDVKKDYSLMVALEFAKTTIAKAKGGGK